MQRVRSASSSILVHLLILALLFALTFETPTPAKVVRISTELPEHALLTPEFLEADEMDFVAPTEGASSRTGPQPPRPDPAATTSLESLPRPPEQSLESSFARVEADAPSRPLSQFRGELRLGDVVDGLAGSILESGGVAGSVDRITREIVRQLAKGPVLVVWIFDGSGSLAERREEVVERFDRVNRELQKLGKMREDHLLNAVVGFGRQVQFATDPPVADVPSLQKAVRSLKPDESGEERVFSAVRAAAQKYRRYQTHGRRNVMMIVVTDEAGDDLEVVDDCIQLVRRNRIPVYVLGPMAPFGRRSVEVPWVDEPTGEVFQIPVDCGPETVQPEHLALPYWADGPKYDVIPSGFGPFGLTLLARKSGGVYFLFDESRFSGPRFDRDVMTLYAPEYVTLAEYSKNVAKQPLRQAVVQVVEWSKDALGQPRMVFSAQNLNENLTNAQRNVAATVHVVDRSIALLSQVEKERKKEDSPRWQAHFDLILGRLLATRIRANEYNWALAQMKVNPPPLRDGNNHWRLDPDPEVRFGTPFAQDARKAKRDAKTTEQARADAERAVAILRRVVEERPGTPWELLAKRELDVPLSFTWEQFYIPPPPDVSTDPNPQPPRPNPREEAAKRVPKL